MTLFRLLMLFCENLKFILEEPLFSLVPFLLMTSSSPVAKGGVIWVVRCMLGYTADLPVQLFRFDPQSQIEALSFLRKR